MVFPDERLECDCESLNISNPWIRTVCRKTEKVTERDTESESIRE
jgi:hypothetical protein